MHYKNGREAKNGDKVVLVSDYAAVIGILYDATAGNDVLQRQARPDQPERPLPQPQGMPPSRRREGSHREQRHRMKTTLSMIVRNEERNLPACLDPAGNVITGF